MPRKSVFLATIPIVVLSFVPPAHSQDASVKFTVHSARSGVWSEPATWAEEKIPGAGDNVQVRAGHVVTYDANSDRAIRVLHVAGTLEFARDRATRLDVGLIKIQSGAECTEDGFDCDAHATEGDGGDETGETRPALLIGTADNPIPVDVNATIRLVHFDGMNRETLPAIVNCGGRWEVHGAPMNRTWVKLGATAKLGGDSVELAEPVTGWRVGDRVIVTASKEATATGSFRPTANRAKPGNTEERLITMIEGRVLTLDQALEKEHIGAPFSPDQSGASFRPASEVANLSRNIVIESADPGGVRGHTMFHRGSTGGISYAEFRHLGKEGVLGKYSIHFHLVRDSMRGSGVVGASIWDSHNRWITIHGTDYLLVRDCVGYQSVGHGFFLEDGTEQYNVLDRNLAVQAFRGKRLPKQVLPFDANDGAGFWWANGRNTLTRNVACENDEYGFRFEITKASNFDPTLRVRQPDGSIERRDVRTIPFYRFEDNESHSEGLYSFNFGDDRNGSVHGDREHPFIARNLRAWETHYVLRPNLQYFLMDGLTVVRGVYGVYHPDYDAHVYRNIYFDNVNSEPINRGHDDESIQYGTFTYDNLTILNSRIGRDPLIQMACTSPVASQAGHFRNVTIKNSESRQAKVVDLGGGPRNSKLENPVAYFFHDYFVPGRVTKVTSAKFSELPKDADYKSIDGFTGPDVRAADVTGVEFPALLEPVDDLPPATIITSVRAADGKVVVRGTSHDNGDIASVTVNSQRAKVLGNHAGVLDWEIVIDSPADGAIVAHVTDKSGNEEKMSHSRRLK
jgi:hypothetical protein